MADGDLFQRFDLSAGHVSNVRHTPQGGLVAKASLTRTGVFTYAMPDGSKRRELRHPDEVFHPDTLASFKHAPITVDHPGRVTPENWREHVRGHLADPPHVEGDHVVGDVVLQDARAIKDAEDKKLVEVSCGYECKIDETPGTYNGEKYDVAQKAIRINHVAIGPPSWGRMGSTVRLHLDSGAAVSGSDVVEDELPDDDEDTERADYLGEWVKRNTSPKMEMSERKALGREAKKEAMGHFKAASGDAYRASSKAQHESLNGGTTANTHREASSAHKAAAQLGSKAYHDFAMGRATAEKLHDKIGDHEFRAQGHEAAAKGGPAFPPKYSPQHEMEKPAAPAAPPAPPPASQAFPFAAHDVARDASAHAERASEATRGGVVINQVGEASERAAHKVAGEAHLHAAAAHEAAAMAATGQGDTRSSYERSSKGMVEHVKEAIGHKEKAAEHAEKAGGDWDESKHPRDHGKFDTLSLDDTHAHFAGEFGSKAREASATAHEASAKASSPAEHAEASQAHLNAMFANRYAGNAEGDKAHRELAVKHASAAGQGDNVPRHIRQLAHTAALEKAHSDHPIFSGPKAEATHFVAVEKTGEKNTARGAGVTRVAAMEHARSLGHHEPLEIQRTTPEHAAAFLEKHPHPAPSEYETMKSNFLDKADDGITGAFAGGGDTDVSPPSGGGESSEPAETEPDDDDKYPVDTRVNVLASRVLLESNRKAGRLSDAKYKHHKARIAAAEKRQGTRDSGADSATASRADGQPYNGGMNEEERKALELAQAKALDAADKLSKSEVSLKQAKADAATKANELVTVTSERDLLKLQVGRLTADAVVETKKADEDKAFEARVEETIAVRATAAKIIGNGFKHDGKSVADIKLEVLKHKEPDFTDVKTIEEALKSSDLAVRTPALGRLDSLYSLVTRSASRADTARAEVRAIGAGPIGEDAAKGEDDDEEVDVGKARKAMEKRKAENWMKTPKRIDRIKKTTDRRSA